MKEKQKEILKITTKKKTITRVYYNNRNGHNITYNESKEWRSSALPQAKQSWAPFRSMLVQQRRHIQSAAHRTITRYCTLARILKSRWCRQPVGILCCQSYFHYFYGHVVARKKQTRKQHAKVWISERVVVVSKCRWNILAERWFREIGEYVHKSI